MSVRAILIAAAAGAALAAQIGAAHAQVPGSKTLEQVKTRGFLSCGTGPGVVGFSMPDDKGVWTGLDVDFCRGIAAAIFNDPEKVKFVPLTAKDRFTALQSGEVDVLARNGTWTLSREAELGLLWVGVNYYDGQGFLVRKKLNVNSALELSGASICVQQGTTTELNVADFFRSNNMKYEVVAFATSSAARGEIALARQLLERAVAAGADCIGGTPNLAPDPTAYIDMLLDVAERHGLPVDLHVDETLDPQARCFDHLVEQTRRRRMGGRVVGSHVCSLSAVPDDDARRSIDAAVQAGVAVCTLPAANLFLQGRDRRQLVPRGLTRVGDMIDAGVLVATASDNIRDAFVPVGSGDVVEMARWTILAANLLTDAADRAYRMITDIPATIMGMDGRGSLRVGAKADLVISGCANVEDLIAGGAGTRAVLHNGQLVAGAL